MNAEEQLTAMSADLANRYPDEADEQAREAALEAACRLLMGDETVVDELAAELAVIRQRDAIVKAALGQLARMLIEPSAPGVRVENSEGAFARRVGVNRLTVRGWLGK